MALTLQRNSRLSLGLRYTTITRLESVADGHCCGTSREKKGQISYRQKPRSPPCHETVPWHARRSINTHHANRRVDPVAVPLHTRIGCAVIFSWTLV